MEQIIKELEQIVGAYAKKMSDIPDEDFSAKPLPDKWSKKEVIGHLIDSAHNNHRRFVVGQYAATPPKISYDQDFWVAANNYQDMNKAEVLALWHLVNKRIAAVLYNMPGRAYQLQCDTGKETENLRTLEWLAADYVSHMKHHLNQVIAGSFEIIKQ